MPGHTIHIVEPAGAPDRGRLVENIAGLRTRGFEVRHIPMRPDPGWPHASAGAAERCAALAAALCDEACDYVIAARGGYGASDLLPLLNWEELRRARPKCIVGLSDVTALQVAIHERVGWCGLHGVMPGGVLWQPGSAHTEHLLQLLEQGPPWTGSLPVVPVVPTPPGNVPAGKLLGGCLAVLTGLIGTPYAPASWADSILFIEDVNENPGRLMRFWNQWIQSGALSGVQGLIVGQLAGVSDRREVLAEFARRTPCPVFSCELFGHEAPSFALGQGARARIESQLLHWEIDRI